MSQCHDAYDYESGDYPAPEEPTTDATPSCHDGYDQPLQPPGGPRRTRPHGRERSTTIDHRHPAGGSSPTPGRRSEAGSSK